MLIRTTRWMLGRSEWWSERLAGSTSLWNQSSGRLVGFQGADEGRAGSCSAVTASNAIARAREMNAARLRPRPFGTRASTGRFRIPNESPARVAASR